MSRAIQICKIRFHINFFTVRTFVLFSVMFCLLKCFIGPVKELAQKNNLQLTMFIFPLINGYFSTQMVLVAGGTILFASAPFQDELTPYLQIRTRSYDILLGNIIYILSASFLYVIFVLVVSILCLLPVMDYSMEWGSGWFEIIQNENIDKSKLVFPISATILYNYNSIQALTIALICTWFVEFLFGLIIYLLNYLTDKSIGIIAVMALIVMDLAIFNMYPYKYLLISPISLSILSNYQVWFDDVIISIKYGMLFYFVTSLSIILFLLVIGLLKCNNQQLFKLERREKDGKQRNICIKS